jgi:hypothetical protein
MLTTSFWLWARCGRRGGPVLSALEVAQQIAAHDSSRATGLYDRRGDGVSLDEVERIVIWNYWPVDGELLPPPLKPDLYTKSILTVIALLLGVIACNQYVHG